MYLINNMCKCISLRIVFVVLFLPVMIGFSNLNLLFSFSDLLSSKRAGNSFHGQYFLNPFLSL